MALIKRILAETVNQINIDGINLGEILKFCNCFLPIVALFVLFFFSQTAFAEYDPNKVKIKTCEDVILWTGYGRPDEFDPALIEKDSARKVVFEKGLNIYEEGASKGDSIQQALLAGYYFDDKKEFRKGLCWAYKAASLGNLPAMEILKGAYLDGEGVIKDTSECLKWSFLMAALGNDHDKKFLENLEKKYPNNQEILEGKRRAQIWAKEHPEVFFSPN